MEKTYTILANEGGKFKALRAGIPRRILGQLFWLARLNLPSVRSFKILCEQTGKSSRAMARLNLDTFNATIDKISE